MYIYMCVCLYLCFALFINLFIQLYIYFQASIKINSFTYVYIFYIYMAHYPICLMFLPEIILDSRLKNNSMVVTSHRQVEAKVPPLDKFQPLVISGSGVN